jgi:hypothetical protein
MDVRAEELIMSGGAERLYVDLMYCRGDARALALPEVEQLLDMACEAIKKIAVSQSRRSLGWTALELYPAMK